MSLTTSRHFILALSLLCCPVSVFAAIFCVSTSSQLGSALATASGNGQDDVIRIRNGSYPTVNGQRFEVVVEANHALDISGGWGMALNPCDISNGIPNSTVLDGQAIPGIQTLRIRSPEGTTGSVALRNLSLTNGRGAGVNAGCLNIETGNGASDVLVDRVAINGCFNFQTLSAGALSVSHTGTGEVVVRNNVITENSSQSGPAVRLYACCDQSSIIRFQNNTVTANAPLSSAVLAAGVEASANIFAGSVEFYNNAIVGNGLANQADLSTLGGGVAIGENVFSKSWSGSPNVTGGNVVVSAFQTLFVDYPTDLHPSSSSALRDEGSTFNLIHSGPLDYLGAPRVMGSGVDIGAFELEALLRDGFE